MSQRRELASQRRSVIAQHGKLIALRVVGVRGKGPFVSGDELQRRRGDVGVVADAAPRADLRQGGGETEGGAIRPVGHHCVEHISHGDDAGAKADLLAGEVVWVAAAVETLVMMEHYVGDLRRKVSVTDNVVPDLAV